MQRNLQTPPPAIHGAELNLLHRPAGTVSGDIGEVFRIDVTRVGFAVIDACGHDLAAGMLATYASRLIRSVGVELCGHADGPGLTLHRLNEELCRANLEECRFVTALFAVYDERTRILRWARAGAPHPVLLGRNGEAMSLFSRGSLLGVIDDADYETVETRLQCGDTLVVATDGLTDLLGLDLLDATQETGERGQPSSRSSVLRIQERLAEWRQTLDLADSAGCERDDATVLALTLRSETRVSKDASRPRALPVLKQWARAPRLCEPC